MILLQSLNIDSILWWESHGSKLFTSFFVNLVAVTILIRGIYYTHYRRTDLFLTFFGFNITIFLLTFILNQVQMSMGAAFGLFAIFSMLRYRTEGVSAKDMTYLFIVIALGLMNAVSNTNIIQSLVIVSIMLLSVALLESHIFIRKESSKILIYDNVQLIAPAKRSELLDDLSNRTGLNVKRVDIQEFDLLKDAVTLTIYYFE
jgi:hypothetical protein